MHSQCLRTRIPEFDAQVERKNDYIKNKTLMLNEIETQKKENEKKMFYLFACSLVRGYTLFLCFLLNFLLKFTST